MSIHAHFKGRLTRNAEAKQVNDKQVIKFSVATERFEKKEKVTTYVNCDWWSNSTIANHLVKGKEVVVHGTIFNREYQAKDGSTKTSMECAVRELDLCGSKNDDSKSDDAGSYKSNGKTNPGEPFDDSVDVPF